MTIGSFIVSEIVFSHFRLDGGCMFGSVPKNLWSRQIRADEENCIPLVSRSILIEWKDRCFLVDSGMGEKWSEKQKKIYAIRNTPRAEWGFNPEKVTDVILTHLHFDHAGGMTAASDSGLALVFPQARVHLQKANWIHARHPSLKDRASYLRENIDPLEHADLVLHEGSVELVPGLRLHRVDGHTRGQQWIEVNGGGSPLFFATDMIPTAHHIPLAYHLGYDVCAGTLLEEKAAFLSRARGEGALVCFQHDADTAASRIGVADNGQFTAERTMSVL